MALPTCALAQKGAAQAPVQPATEAHSNHHTYTWRVIDAPHGTYGYEVMREGRIVVRHTSVPGLPGVEGCRTSGQAMALAEMEVAKLHCGQMPPTLGRDEVYSVVGR